ncbi:hypothetical protein Ssi02_34210 [Sinosporangium siamense]|uniref:NlpC/P60 domain-containing protein n=1 Tax=Sinosporangium siamense TaxID=1367973 RepID=A0A919RFY9_9ACTN|nr:hypothetical protein Ssi02_34210 [Sinosporangium siamense]
MLDQRARVPPQPPPHPPSPPRGGLTRALAEARRDLAYRPRLWPYGAGPVVVRRVMGVVGAAVAGTLVVGLMALADMSAAEPEPSAAGTGLMRMPAERRGGEPASGTASGADGFVAGTGPVRPVVEQVAPLKGLRKPHLFVVARKSIDQSTADRVARVKGVRAVELADAASVTMDGKKVQTLGVSPSSFRAYTPKSTANSDSLWANVAAGDVAVSFVLGNDGGLRLGGTAKSGARSLRIGAYATMGLGTIDAVVSRQTARSLGLPENNALVVSAPSVDSAKLRRTLLRVLPKGTQIASVNPVAPKVTAGGSGQTGQTGQIPWSAESFMSSDQIRTALTAAASKLGRPYVWGAEGPDTFDCSGLVQWAYAQAGIRVPRVTHQQFVAGPHVPMAQIQPGDLIFWRHDPTNPGYVSHVAIYWGDGKMLHAPRTGDVVKISPVSTRNLAGVVRISPGVAARVR